MAQPITPPIPPVRRSVSVSWAPDAAFRRFTTDFGDWWPHATHSIGGRKVKRIVFECRVAGRIIEELIDGRRYLWGTVTAFDPPTRVAFTWHPSKAPDQAQDVAIAFIPEGAGTRVELVATGWERLGTRGRRARRGYGIGWGSVLDTFAGRTSAAMVIFGILVTVITTILKVTGKLERSIDRAGGRLP